MKGRQSPAHIALTGASSGIGEALSLEFARPGRILSLFARRAEQLEAVASRARARGAEVHWHAGDVRDAARVTDWLSAAHDRAPLDLVVANAGIFDGHGVDGRLETSAEAKDLIETNLLGAILTAQAALPLMIARRSGHIAFISSLAAWAPAADAPTYSATKAGVAAYAEALREYLLPYDICVSTVLPGHVRSVQTDQHEGPLPLILSADAAARRISAALERRQVLVVLPRRAGLLVALGRILPWRLRARANAGARFTVKKTD